jgi:hypothetical protein
MVIVVTCVWDCNKGINNTNGVFSGVTRYNWWSEVVEDPNIVQYCTMLGLLGHLWTPNCTCYSTEEAVRIVNSSIYNPNHTSLQSLTSIYYAATRLHNYNRYTFVTTVTYSTLARIHSLRALHFNVYCTIAHKVP